VRWVTRQDVRLAGTACPWLITRFIDDDAEFGFFPPVEAARAAALEQAKAFDVPDAEFGAAGGAFAAIIAAYNLVQPGLDPLAAIVAAAETGSDAAPEAAGLAAIVDGVALSTDSDIERQRLLWPVYDALLAVCATREEEQYG
jgi:hypothetical protein